MSIFKQIYIQNDISFIDREIERNLEFIQNDNRDENLIEPLLELKCNYRGEK
jgi:hypothetical protein